MSETSDNPSHRKLSRSSTARSARSILGRRKDGREEESGSEENGRASMAAPTASQSSLPVMSHQQSLRGHTPVPRVSAPGSRVSLSDKGASIEQSVRKFRVVEALRSGETKAIAKAVRDSYDPAAAAGLDDTTILHLAIQCAELPVVEFVLSNSNGHLDINARDRDGNTPLHVAAALGRIPIVRLLLDWPDINDAVPNNAGKLPIHTTRNPEIYQILQLSQSLFSDAKIKEVRDLVARGRYDSLTAVLEEPRLRQLLDVNRPEFASEKATVDTGGSLLHEAARRKDAKLIEVLLLHGADPFRRDKKGRLPQDVTKDDVTRAMLKRSPAAQAAQRGIQERAVLGHTASQDVAASSSLSATAATTSTAASAAATAAAAAADPNAGRESREMQGYLKKWTNYRKGYQLRWFVLENGCLSYYKHQDDAETVCSGVISMRVAQLSMSPDEKTKFEISGKPSVKWSLKANHEVEAMRWYWALSNSIQWKKDQAREEERQKARSDEILRKAKAEQKSSSGLFSTGQTQQQQQQQQQQQHSEGGSVGIGVGVSDISRVPSYQSHAHPHSHSHSHSNSLSLSQSHLRPSNAEAPLARVSTAGSADDEYVDVAGADTGSPIAPGDSDEDDPRDDMPPVTDAAASKDALNITAQSAKLQLEFIAQVNAALDTELTRNPATKLSDPKVTEALTTYDAAARSLKSLIGDLLKISRDRDDYWQYRLNQEVQVRRMWEETMAKVALEQEELQTRVGEAEKRRKLTKRALREVMETAMDGSQSQGPSHSPDDEPTATAAKTATTAATAATAETAATTVPPTPRDGSHGQGDVLASQKSPTTSLLRRAVTRNISIGGFDDPGSESDDEEFFDAVDAGEVEIAEMPPRAGEDADGPKAASGLDISSSFKGYENGIRTRLKIEADNRPKISLWGILKSMIGKDMTKMTLPVTFNEPTSLLYRCAEDMEYGDLLDLAVERTDGMERLLYVAAFAVSEYASTIGRVAKPFNPLLGETFEYVRPDKNYRLFIEQVSHHPPVGAAWVESPRWTYFGESAVRSKFYGKSFDINPLGTWNLRLRPVGGVAAAGGGVAEELYTWKKVTTSVVGIITGNPTVDNYGPMEVRNWTTGEVCVLDFKPRGWKASSAYQVTGKAQDATGRVRFSVGGRWNSRLYARRTPGYYEATLDEMDARGGIGGINGINDVQQEDQAFLLWQANERPPGIPFNLTPFALTFNHIDDRLRPWLAPTDSRLRPDQRAMEEGLYDLAADEKNRLEEAQRTRRREREQQGDDFRPHWFEKRRSELTGDDYWHFNGRYWDVRDRAGSGEGRAAWEAEGLETIYGVD